MRLELRLRLDHHIYQCPELKIFFNFDRRVSSSCTLDSETMRFFIASVSPVVNRSPSAFDSSRPTRILPLPFEGKATKPCATNKVHKQTSTMSLNGISPPLDRTDAEYDPPGQRPEGQGEGPERCCLPFLVGRMPLCVDNVFLHSFTIAVDHEIVGIEMGVNCVFEDRRSSSDVGFAVGRRHVNEEPRDCG
ncbi:hypothetical protein THAOC_27764 [Thalassiosira oceanica]|uniref:Uncharacterized protein n=1 Tax=Thalassiosira oceanica TaxID=159749 RepID=K0RI36_THAOC|nr:hypothetical protein THAOC_27764 [Thalassiosira oceanica]|eukprot:EJK52910.1 hypothetical protein THAOC_27764 [Thalassiosira oceanica]